MKIIVTGGAGFIGSNFIFYMSDKHSEYEIICIDKLTYAGNIYTINKLIDSGKIKFYKADICNRTDINSIFKETMPDVVVNFAAESHVDRSISDPGIFLNTNIIGTQVLLDASLRYNIKRFHQVSTDEVYGDLPINRPDLLFTEKTSLNPSSPYSVSKASADMLTMSYFRTYGLPVTISRCSNNYGRFQFPEKLIPLTIINALSEKEIPVYGTGENIRDWLYVDDHCEAISYILERGKIGDVYNIGGNNEKSNIEIVRRIIKELNKSDDLIKYVEDRKGHDLRYAINPTKIENELDWKSETTFDKELSNTINWYVKNRNWWEKILSGKYRINNL